MVLLYFGNPLQSPVALHWSGLDHLSLACLLWSNCYRISDIHGDLVPQPTEVYIIYYNKCMSYCTDYDGLLQMPKANANANTSFSTLL